jgi:hypothetical protein
VINEKNVAACGCQVQTFVRNRYFYGKLLDVFHFELEQYYLNAKRWLINRLVGGYGVICGLDVQPGPDGNSIVVSPGVAIDKWGREIIVPVASAPVPLPAPTATPDPSAVGDECPEDANCVSVCICYLECDSDPVPGLGGDCDQNVLCSAGSIRERYKIVINPGKLPSISTDCAVPDLISGTKINYPALAQYVSGPCPDCPDDPCIGLANINLPGSGGKCQMEHIDIAVRPIVYTNDLIHDLMVCLTNKATPADAHRAKN